MSAFEDKLDQQARARMDRIRMEADPLSMPYVPDALEALHGSDNDGFLSPDEAAVRMDISREELLRLVDQGVLATRGRGHGLRVRPALVSGAVSASPRARPARGATRDLEIAAASRPHDADRSERPHVRVADDG